MKQCTLKKSNLKKTLSSIFIASFKDVLRADIGPKVAFLVYCLPSWIGFS
jgi:hypothetical protein